MRETTFRTVTRAEIELLLQFVREYYEFDHLSFDECIFRLWDKLRALDLIGRRLKMFVDRVETTENAQDEAYKLLLKKLREGEQK